MLIVAKTQSTPYSEAWLLCAEKSGKWYVFGWFRRPNRLDSKARHGGDTQNAMPERPHAVDDTYPSQMR
ncbi:MULTISPECIES: hypothetical protein [unclassified Agrobacterium]|uniref:hypothetical protein n=1 Tax=unclassified Agrobacterium TaxID=2632611 RepID=UPI0013AF9529|nr:MULTISPECIES: hypothetical protein [unclassified Agrobacterium]MBO9111847.1 hypothetical protein [Agrobacterium sp. S2/73]QXZ76655.1 hypothetical protein J5276_29950 [Agrobacterium sp. S7/73]